MSTAFRLSALAFASTVLASPHGHANAHRHLHSGSAAPYPYSGMKNSTSIYGTTGTGPASYASPTAYGGETTITSTVTGQTTLYTTIFETVHLSAAPSGASVGAAAVSSGECGADVTVTSTEQVYVTVTAGDMPSSSSAYSAPAYSAPSSSSSEAAPVSISSSAAPVSTSSSAAPVYSAPTYTPSTESSSSSSVVAVLPTSYSVADKGYAASTTASAPASYSSAASTSGKRGLAYDDASLTECFSGSSQVSWAYNWVSSSGGLTGYSYIPTLHSNEEVFLASWITDVETALSGGSTTLFSFNEPDIASQANMDVATAVSAYKANMAQFSSKAKVCAPSVSNSGDANQGLDYLQQFLDQCTGDDCPIDCLNIHWYATCDAESFISHVDSAVSMLTGDQTLYITEFGVTDGSDSDIASFLETVMAYMDSNDKVAGYAYYMVSDGLLVSGSEPSTYGSTYMSYSS